MNFVALALLESCGGDDENAFWILAGMCANLELEASFCDAAFDVAAFDVAVSASRSSWHFRLCFRGPGCLFIEQQVNPFSTEGP